MNIEIKCFATLAAYAPSGGVVPDVPEGADVASIMALLRVPPDEVKIIFVNGTHAEPDAVLHDGDRVGLFPAVGGG